jgi:uncharacterized protein YbaR (Trm112 family)
MIDVCPVCKSDLITVESSRETETTLIGCDDCHFLVQAHLCEDELLKHWNDMDRRKFSA